MRWRRRESTWRMKRRRKGSQRSKRTRWGGGVRNEEKEETKMET